MRMQLRHGFISLTILFLLLPLAILTLWGSQTLLTRYAKIHFNHKKAQQSHWKLEQESTDFQKLKQQCAEIKRDDHQPFRINFSENLGVAKLQFGSFCRYFPLLGAVPKKNLLLEQWQDYVHEDLLTELHIFPYVQPLVLTKKMPLSVYYLDKAENEIVVQGTVYALILAKGNLHIRGKGTLRGMIITQGQLYGLQRNRYGAWVEDTQRCTTKITSRCKDKIRLVYDKNIPILLHQLGKWAWQKGSWYDYQYTY